jgi:hypothetical protein
MEKMMTAIWYSKMSGESDWDSGEKFEYLQNMEAVSARIRDLQG